MTAKAKTKPATAVARIEALGIDALCERITAGESQTAVASSLGVGIASLITWIAADFERSARMKEARAAAAGSYADKAEAVLAEATDPFELAKARELASHYRWRASKSNPREYGDKLEIDQTTTFTNLPDEEIAKRRAQIAAQLAAAQPAPAAEA